MKIMQIIGILGGLGPETTANFYVKLNNISSLNYRIPLLIWNSTINLELEKNFLLTGEGLDNYLEVLKKGIDHLIKGGANFIVIPCNSVHGLIDDLRKYSKIPILSIIEENIKNLIKNKVKNIGLLSSGYTEKSKLYENKLLENNINVIKPEKLQQKNINEIIFRLVNGSYTNNDKDLLNLYIADLFNRGADKILLACTDLQILIKENDNIIDSMNILAINSYNKLIQLGKQKY